MSKEYLEVFFIRNYKVEEEEKSFWTRIGTAFKNEKDNSYNVLLDLLPMPDKESGKIHMHIRPPLPKEEQSSSSDSKSPAIQENIMFTNENESIPEPMPEASGDDL